MNFLSLLSVGAGAILGAWLRWWLGLRLNAMHPSLPMGTLAANLIGGYIIGLAAGAVMENVGLTPQSRLFIMTGFCGGLTTFSTFSIETVTLFTSGQTLWAFGEIVIHVGGSLAATTLGLYTVRLLKVLAQGAT
jgi:CrcB protein